MDATNRQGQNVQPRPASNNRSTSPGGSYASPQHMHRRIGSQSPRTRVHGQADLASLNAFLGPSSYPTSPAGMQNATPHGSGPYGSLNRQAAPYMPDSGMHQGFSHHADSSIPTGTASNHGKLGNMQFSPRVGDRQPSPGPRSQHRNPLYQSKTDVTQQLTLLENMMSKSRPIVSPDGVMAMGPDGNNSAIHSSILDFWAVLQQTHQNLQV